MDKFLEQSSKDLVLSNGPTSVVICDGRSCGMGQRVVSNIYLCPHNNFAVMRSDLVCEWHPQNTVLPTEVLPYSHKKVWWVCKNTYCGCHQWETTVANRSQGKGCPYCVSKSICIHDSLQGLYPKIALEWHPVKNGSLLPSQIAPMSHISVWWKCSINPCGCHEWYAIVANRTNLQRNCPYCTNQKICLHNSLYSTHLDIAKEWHYERNYPILPTEVSSGTNKKFWWKCSINPCGCHEWEVAPNDRIQGDSGCPFCSNRNVCPHNSLQGMFPDVAREWCFLRNGGITPDAVVYGSQTRYYWTCSKFPHHVWKTTVYSRTSQKTGCRHCVASKGYSKVQITWLQQVEKEQNIILRTAIHPDGEYRITSAGKVDGYHADTNTVYEYHGDYWHGNPLIYDQSDLNERAKKTFGELYAKTLERDCLIRSLGYNLIVQWETEIEEYQDYIDSFKAHGEHTNPG